MRKARESSERLWCGTISSLAEEELHMYISFGPPTGGCGRPSVFMKSEVYERWISIIGGAGTALGATGLPLNLDQHGHPTPGARLLPGWVTRLWTGKPPRRMARYPST